jgi:starch synthase
MLKVLLVSPEVVPFAKTGGLADVTGSLPQALKRIGCDVRVVMPFYRVVQRAEFKYKALLEDIEVSLGTLSLKGNIQLTRMDGNMPVYFAQSDELYDRSNLYGTPKCDYYDNAERFIFLSKIIFPLCRGINFRPDIIHCHDWQTALVPAYLKTVYNADSLFDRTASILTIHNVAYQGIFEQEKFALTGLPPEVNSMTGMEYWGKISFLKAGIVFADIITTVSEGHSKEIQTEEYGFGFQGILKGREDDLYGVVNGVDYDRWNPETDPYIAAHYNAYDLSGKVDCKRDLLKCYRLPMKLKNKPLLGIISRLADQKGFDLLADMIDDLLTLDIGLVILGKGEMKYHQIFEKIAKRYPKKMGITIGFDNALAHKIEAGSDIFLMPSRYEPCGLNQIYSMKYGTIPVVRATGGLDDTVSQFDPKTETGTGFKFEKYNALAFLDAIRKALVVYSNKKKWTQLMNNAMKVSFTWEKSAQEYVKLYKKALAKRKGQNLRKP